MLTTRIIPCLDVRNNRVVKGVNFQNLRDSGDPAELAAAYEQQGADEIVILDITATNDRRKTQLETVLNVRKVLSIPLTVGGGVQELSDVGRLLDAGADRVSANSAAVRRPELISEIAESFGVQCTVVAIDAKRNVQGQFKVVTNSGQVFTELDVVQWAQESERRGAGELLLTSFDRDGTRTGYDLELMEIVSSAVRIPVIASGGANCAEHLSEAIEAGAAAVLAASIFHGCDYTVATLKQKLNQLGKRVRI